MAKKEKENCNKYKYPQKFTYERGGGKNKSKTLSTST